MNEKNPSIIFWAANFLALLAFISLNIYLPSLPTLAQVFNTQPANLKLSITLFLISFALSQFFWGSISVRYGRKKTVITGLIVADIGTLMAMLASNILVFNTARLIEGAGIGAASVLCRALLTDALELTQLSRALAYVSITGNVMPALAPIIGGYLMVLFNWRAIFLFLAIYDTALIIIFYLWIQETSPFINKDFKLAHALQEYILAFKNPTFLGYLLPFVILSGGMLGYYAATPFIFINHLHVPAQHYAFLSVSTVVSYIIGAQLSNRLMQTLGSNKAILCGLGVGIMAAILSIIFSSFSSLSIVTVLIPMILYTCSAGLIAANATACALATLKKIAGAAAAVIGGSVYAVSAIFTTIITALDLSKLSSLTFYICGIVLLAAASFYSLIIIRDNKSALNHKNSV